MNSATRKLLIWIYSLVAAALGGVGTALGAFLTGQAIGAIDFTPRQLGAIAVGGAISAAEAYLKNSPLPKLDDDLVK